MSAIRAKCPYCISPVGLDPPEILLLPGPPPERSGHLPRGRPARPATTRRSGHLRDIRGLVDASISPPSPVPGFSYHG